MKRPGSPDYFSNLFCSDADRSCARNLNVSAETGYSQIFDRSNVQSAQKEYMTNFEM